jgi:hypothetical protein
MMDLEILKISYKYIKFLAHCLRIFPANRYPTFVRGYFYLMLRKNNKGGSWMKLMPFEG